MDDSQKAAIKAKIISLIEEAELSIVKMQDMAQPVKPENSLGRISRMDAINNKSVVDAAIRTKKSKLGKLKVALNSLDKKDFGFCSACKNPIQEGRLIFMPESTLCVRCASRG